MSRVQLRSISSLIINVCALPSGITLFPRSKMVVFGCTRYMYGIVRYACIFSGRSSGLVEYCNIAYKVQKMIPPQNPYNNPPNHCLSNGFMLTGICNFPPQCSVTFPLHFGQGTVTCL